MKGIDPVVGTVLMVAVVIAAAVVVYYVVMNVVSTQGSQIERSTPQMGTLEVIGNKWKAVYDELIQTKTLSGVSLFNPTDKNTIIKEVLVIEENGEVLCTSSPNILIRPHTSFNAPITVDCSFPPAGTQVTYPNVVLKIVTNLGPVVKKGSITLIHTQPVLAAV